MTTSVLKRTCPKESRASDVRRLSVERLAALPDEVAIDAVKLGLPSRLVREMSQRLDLPLEGLTGPLQLTGRTLHRRMQEGTLAQAESERMLALARVYFRAAAVLGEENKARRWLKSNPPALAGRTPLECMQTWLGIRQVERILGRIEGGVYS
jgi:putative toxin-antitoxin system antitoxin component (TIGR02293 family)